MKVLVVDDDPLGRALLCRLLADLGCETEEAADGLEALERAAVAGFDLVVTDWVMPGLDGAGLVAALAELGSAPPVWVASASDPGPGLTWVPKPYDRERLAAGLAALEGGRP